jgi:hypothetical protein
VERSKGIIRTQKIDDDILVAFTLAKEEMDEEKPLKRKLIVHKITVDLETVRNVVEKDKTRFFAKLGFLKPKHEEIECESVLLFYEPFMIAKANYFLDYYENKTYRITVGDDTTEVVVFGQTLKPEVMSERVKGVLKRSHREIVFDAQERVIHKAIEQIALNRTGHEIDPTKLPSAPAEPEPEKVLKECSEKARKLRLSVFDTLEDIVCKRPPNIGRIVEEVLEVTEHTVVYTPIYEARCRHLKTGEIKIIPLSGVTGKMLSL